MFKSGYFIVLFFITVASVLIFATVQASESKNVIKYIMQEEQIKPGNVSELVPASMFSPIENENLRIRLLELRERTVSKVDNNPISPPGLPLIRGTKTKLVKTGLSKPDENVKLVPRSLEPRAFTIGRNMGNPKAQGEGNSTIAEPVAANEGRFIVYGGNTHLEYTLDGGNNWYDFSFPEGPSDAPIPCCDLDIIYDQPRARFFISVLYVNKKENPTNGIVRIFVGPPSYACYYDIDPDGAANNIIPDYPHLGISNKFLYLTTNNARNGTEWVGAQVRRFNIDQMVDCSFLTSKTFTYTGEEQRVFVPVEGARDAMYWGMLDNATTFRIFKWEEKKSSPISVTKTISPSAFSNPDCRGGEGNFDFIESNTAWSITGFRLRGAVGGGNIAFYWNVGPDSEHIQGHCHAAVFQESNLKLIAQPHIFNDESCIGYPAVSVNERGDFGISIAAGGMSGGDGEAAQGYVGIDDEYTKGIGNFDDLYITAIGTHNRPDGRYGDYFTCHPHEPCDMFFNATNYALYGGTNVSNVNARYIEFGRNRDYPCYIRWYSQ